VTERNERKTDLPAIINYTNRIAVGVCAFGLHVIVAFIIVYHVRLFIFSTDKIVFLLSLVENFSNIVPFFDSIRYLFSTLLRNLR